MKDLVVVRSNKSETGKSIDRFLLATNLPAILSGFAECSLSSPGILPSRQPPDFRWRGSSTQAIQIQHFIARD
jgi:hypothetical protein